jgi:hypothetical protein
LAGLGSVAEISEAVAQLRGRNAKTELLARYLRSLVPPEAAIAALYLTGKTEPARTGIGPAASRPPLASHRRRTLS